MTLAYLLGTPVSKADYKTHAEDFAVDEVLDIPFTGEGEHVCLNIIKRFENTQFIAKQIAKLAGCPVKNVSYAGLKDRNAVTSQWFSVPVAIKKDVDFSALNSDTVFVKEQVRHNRKLRTGCHKGNRFDIKLRNVTDLTDILCRINALKKGVPNYFGPQRFGHNGNNLVLFEKLIQGEPPRERKLKSIVISAGRSFIFNQIVSERVKAHGLAKTFPEEVFLLNGSNAFFKEQISPELLKRLEEHDILLSGPMVGKGDAGVTHYEQAWLEPHQVWVNALCDLGLKAERRALILVPEDFEIEIHSQSEINVRFTLPKGAFATAVLRELVHLTDASIKEQTDENLTE